MKELKEGGGIELPKPLNHRSVPAVMYVIAIFLVVQVSPLSHDIKNPASL